VEVENRQKDHDAHKIPANLQIVAQGFIIEAVDGARFIGEISVSHFVPVEMVASTCPGGGGKSIPQEGRSRVRNPNTNTTIGKRLGKTLDVR
jgi:hypothetical protein